MKKIFTLFSAIAIGTLGFGQVVFQSNLSTWSAGAPTDWMGAKTNLATAPVEVPMGSTYGASDAQITEASGSHKRFTTQPLAVTSGQSYEINFWVKGQGDIRTGLFDNNPTDFGYIYNSYVSVNSITPVLYTQTITALATLPTAEFILSIRNTVGPGHLVVDSVSVTAVATPPVSLVSIYDIQYTTASPANSPESGNVVTTKGVVTGVFQIGGDVDRYFIQDGDGPWNGIFVFDNAHTVTIGDSVLVTGTVSEFNTLTEIGFVSAVTILNSGNVLPTPATVTNATIGNEEYEGVLVKLNGAICTTVTDAFGVWKANDGTGTPVSIDDDLLSAIYNPTLGNGYTVIGVRHFSFGENVLLPRTQVTDIITTGFASIEENTSFSIYPNPASSSIKLNIQANATVKIYALTGELIYSGNGNGLIDVTNFSKGLYQVVVTQNEITSTQKLIVQ